MKHKIINVMLVVTILMLMSMIILPTAMAYSVPVIEPTDPGIGEDLTDAGGKVAGVIAAIAAGVAIVILLWLAIRYMTGSAADKADIKKSAVPYLIGAILLFAASGVLGIIQTFGSGLFSNSGGGSGESAYERHPGQGTEVIGTGESEPLP